MIPTRIRHLINKTANFRDEKVMFHPEPNVCNHLGQVGTLALNADDNFDVCYAAILHDIAKNTTDKKAWAQHAYRGALLVARDVTDKVKWLVENHMRLLAWENGEMRPHKSKALEEHPFFEDLVRLSSYDKGGRNEDGIHMPWDEIYTALDEKDSRANKATILIGIQACGKSTLSHAIVDASRDFGAWWMPEAEHTSKDDLRLALGIGPGAWRHQEDCVEEIQRLHIRMALGRGQHPIVDNTHNTVKRRRRILEWLREEFPGIQVEAHFVYAPLDVCLKRNASEHGKPHRHRVRIPDDVIKQFHSDLLNGFGGKVNDDARIIKQLESEGFDKVSITRSE